MKVWVLLVYGRLGDTIHSVYGSKHSADRAKAKIAEDYSYAYIEEWPILKEESQ